MPFVVRPDLRQAQSERIRTDQGDSPTEQYWNSPAVTEKNIA
jgi:hypothetical protein